MILLWNKIYEYPIANRKQAENYLKRHTMQEFIATRAFNEFLIGRQYGRMVVQWFVVYMLLNLWLYKAGGDGALYTDAQLNAAIYRTLTAWHIPVRSPGGWNLSYLLSLIINLYIFCIAIKNERAFWVWRVIKLRWHRWLKIFFYKILALLFALFVALPVFYISPAITAGQKKCDISYDLCFLHGADMYYYDTFITYIECALFFHLIYIAIFTLTLRVIDR